MAPYSNSEVTGVLFENDAETPDLGIKEASQKPEVAEKREVKLVWRNIILFAYLHAAALYGGYLSLTSAKWQTDAFGKNNFINFS